jgi:uncharacterized protein (UPF0332 family)
MTQDKSYKKDLIQYRLESAREMLRDAQLLKENDGSPKSIVNRAYYAVFYASLALLVTADVEPSKHSGVLAKFDELAGFSITLLTCDKLGIIKSPR